MKQFNLRKNLVTAAFGAIVALGGASQAYAAIAPSFTYDMDGVLGGTTVVANGISGTSAELLVSTGTGFAGIGWVQATSLNLNSSGVSNTSYSDTGLFAIFNLTNTLAFGALGQAGSVYNLNSLNVTVKYDSNRNNVFDQVSGTVSNQGDDLVLATSTLNPVTGGQAYLFAFGSVGLQAMGNFALDATNGADFFVAPNPFYTQNFAGFGSTGGSFAFNPITGVLSIGNATGAIDFINKVPEPASLALLGVALLGMGASRRRN